MRTLLRHFGKDHWSLLSYLETFCSHQAGFIINERMRCNPDSHPLRLSADRHSLWSNSQSTRLQGFFQFKDRLDTEKAVAWGFQILGHDDWDCLEDLEAVELIDVICPKAGEVILTRLGLKMASQLRLHQLHNGYSAEFSNKFTRAFDLV